MNEWRFHLVTVPGGVFSLTTSERYEGCHRGAAMRMLGGLEPDEPALEPGIEVIAVEGGKAPRFMNETAGRVDGFCQKVFLATLK